MAKPVKQPPAGKFTLEIELGNDAMRSGSDVAYQLRRVAMAIVAIGTPDASHSRTLRDENGNRVGVYRFES